MKALKIIIPVLVLGCIGAVVAHQMPKVEKPFSQRNRS